MLFSITINYANGKGLITISNVSFKRYKRFF